MPRCWQLAKQLANYIVRQLSSLLAARALAEVEVPEGEAEAGQEVVGPASAKQLSKAW